MVWTKAIVARWRNSMMGAWESFHTLRQFCYSVRQKLTRRVNFPSYDVPRRRTTSWDVVRREIDAASQKTRRTTDYLLRSPNYAIVPPCNVSRTPSYVLLLRRTTPNVYSPSKKLTLRVKETIKGAGRSKRAHNRFELRTEHIAAPLLQLLLIIY